MRTRSGNHLLLISSGNGDPARAERARGFTLVELIAVLIILAIAATVTLPRFVGNDERRAEAEAEQVRSLVAQAVTQLARPGLDGGRPIAIEHAWGNRQLRIGERESAERGGNWRPQRLSPIVTLERIEVRQGLTDDGPLDVRAGADWRIEMAASRGVPRLSLLLAGERVAGVWQIDVDPDSARVGIRAMPAGTASIVPLDPSSTNLDATGGADLPW